ncbi:MAG: hypothetical protein JO126_07430 [Alphaproteobacteria bacterium]|nr:hypothetical protein [Alphaproteobacteria bacterium]
MSDSNEKQTAFTLWIPSLAVSIVCCSVLFVVFADYLADVKESISGAQARVELLERRTNQLRLDISLMSKRLPPPPVAATPAVPDVAATPAAAPAADATAPAAPTAVPTTITPAEPATAAPAIAVPAVTPPVQK